MRALHQKVGTVGIGVFPEMLRGRPTHPPELIEAGLLQN